MSEKDKLDVVEVIEATPACLGCGASCLTTILAFGFFGSLAVKWGYGAVGWLGVEYVESPASLIVFALSIVAGVVVLVILSNLRISLFGK